MSIPPALRSRISAMMAGKVPGLAIAAVSREGVVWSEGIGLADLATGDPMTVDTSCNWFSMTKVVTATATVQLADAGQLDLDAPAADHFPPLAALQPTERARQITVRQLLSHSAGLTNPLPLKWVHLSGTPVPDQTAFVEALLARHPRLTAAPGSSARYSNVGYLVLGEIIRTVVNRPFDIQVRDSLLTPLGMRRTAFSAGAAGAPRAVGYQRRFGILPLAMRLLVPRVIFDASVGGYTAFRPFEVDGLAYGGLVGPLSDAAKLLALHLRGGELAGQRLLAPESAAMMQRIATPGRPFDLGLGWFRPHSAKDRSPRFIQHRGEGGGFANDMRLYPDLELGVVMMGNASAYDREGIAELVVRAWSGSGG